VFVVRESGRDEDVSPILVGECDGIDETTAVPATSSMVPATARPHVPRRDPSELADTPRSGVGVRVGAGVSVSVALETDPHTDPDLL
jgi:hypothetical protein